MQFIEINGESIPMHYGILTLKSYMSKYKLKRIMDIGQLGEKLTIDDMPGFVKAGFDTAAKIAKDEPPFTLDEVEMLLEEHLWLATAAMEVFGKSVSRPDTGEPDPEDGENPDPDPQKGGMGG